MVNLCRRPDRRKAAPQIPLPWAGSRGETGKCCGKSRSRLRIRAGAGRKSLRQDKDGPREKGRKAGARSRSERRYRPLSRTIRSSEGRTGVPLPLPRRTRLPGATRKAAGTAGISSIRRAQRPYRQKVPPPGDRSGGGMQRI